MFQLMFLIRFYNLFFCLVFCSNKYHRQPKDCIKSFNFHFLILLLGLWMWFHGYFISSFIIVITFVFSFLFNFFLHLVIEQCNITTFYCALMEYLNMPFQCVPAFMRKIWLLKSDSHLSKQFFFFVSMIALQKWWQMHSISS